MSHGNGFDAIEDEYGEDIRHALEEELENFEQCSGEVDLEIRKKGGSVTGILEARENGSVERIKRRFPEKEIGYAVPVPPNGRKYELFDIDAGEMVKERGSI